MTEAQKLYDFVAESNRIEGITREPTESELIATKAFLALRQISVQHLERLVSIYQPNARLRALPGMNVFIGDYVPPPGGEGVTEAVTKLLRLVNVPAVSPYDAHFVYESIHPFTDGNGRSGRALWLWMMRSEGEDTRLGFLHTWYYQSLSSKS